MSESLLAAPVDSEVHSLLSDSRFTSSTYTAPGPGAISGKAIKSLGELTLRGVERIIIYARLRNALAHFPHDDFQAENIKGIGAMYDVILELSRPKFYTPSIRNPALSAMFTQIKEGQTKQLVLALSRWHPEELEILLYGIMYHVTSKSFPLSESIYSNYTPPLKISANQAILLMCHLARAKDAACQIVLDIGLFDLFESMDNSDFSSYELAVIYRTIFYICTRPRYQHEETERRGRLLLILAITQSKPTFIDSLLEWDVQELRLFIDTIWQFKGGQHPLRELHQVEANFLQCFMGLLVSVARISDRVRQMIVHAGYLEVMLFLAKRDFFLQRVYDAFNLPLSLLRYRTGVLGYMTENQTSTAVELVLLYWSRWNGTLDLLKQVDGLDFACCIRLPQLIIEKLRITVNNYAESTRQWSQDRRSIELMMRLLCHIASLGDTAFETIIHAGYLDVLPLLSSHTSGAPMFDILDIPLQVIRPCLPARVSMTDIEKQKAWKILTTEIFSGDYFDLVFYAIRQWASEEIDEFFKLFVTKLNHTISARQSDTNAEYESIHSVITFIAEFALQHKKACQTVLDAGFIDAIRSVPGDNLAVEELILNILEDPIQYPAVVVDRAKAYVLYQNSLKRRRSLWSNVQDLEDLIVLRKV